MDLSLNLTLGESYKSAQQRIRVISESWTEKNSYCCLCGGHLSRTHNNARVLDLICAVCRGGFELKSTSGTFSSKVPDGAFAAMIARLGDISSPNFFFLTYDPSAFCVTNFFAVPTYFLDHAVIEKRKPLGPHARRAGWVGCNIALNRVPEAGKVFYVKGGVISPRSAVLGAWKRTTFLKRESSLEARGWTLEVIRCIEALGARHFTLQQIYQFEPQLRRQFPNNQFVLEKIRQQLQILRDSGLISFEGRGRYSKFF